MFQMDKFILHCVKKKKGGGGVIMSETPLTVLFRIDFNDQFQDSVVSGAKS